MTVTVLHVAQPRDGGVAGYLVAACLDQLARGWKVTVACPDGGRLADDLARAGVPRLRWPAVRGPGADAFAETLRLRGIVERVRPDVLHLHAAKAGLAGRLGPRRALPVIFQPHGWSWLAAEGALRRATLAWERAAARWTDLYLCVGDAEAEQGRAQGVRGRFAVVRNGVDLTRFRPATDKDRADARHALGLDPVAPLAVCVGRVTRQKGQDVLLAAWPEIRRRCPAAELAVVGDGDLLPALRAHQDRGVRYAGASADVRPWLAAADVVVLPSRWEGLSLTVLEAYATGRGVVVSDIPGLAEVVVPEVGARVPAEDPAALAVAVADRLTSPVLTRREGAAAARHAVRYDLRLTFDLLAAETTAVLRGRKELATW
ncbi:glycosyltransferase [Actinoplanes sp. NBRC 103695]|uniref:glycosyltransferase n=1 Tax=Actinoplanes sp. NBRC 103695 TaxID=3032202 RepID=UPI0024A53097|nr:glycosyltransferase [Actinoplanes sp. NBRC 103695]GLY94201.1 glycosyl transferase [Actinoplanes sp. NBRC 103695]